MSRPLRERRPSSNVWTRDRSPCAPVSDDPNTEAWSVWRSARLVVITTLVRAELPDGSGEVGLQWHLSIVRRQAARATDEDVMRTRRAFGLLEAEEDNHEPGRARHLWLPVDPARRVDCECKATEIVVTEPTGHQWSSPPAEVEQRRSLMSRVWGPR